MKNGVDVPCFFSFSCPTTHCPSLMISVGATTSPSPAEMCSQLAPQAVVVLSFLTHPRLQGRLLCSCTLGWRSSLLAASISEASVGRRHGLECKGMVKVRAEDCTVQKWQKWPSVPDFLDPSQIQVSLAHRREMAYLYPVGGMMWMGSKEWRKCL